MVFGSKRSQTDQNKHKQRLRPGRSLDSSIGGRVSGIIRLGGYAYTPAKKGPPPSLAAIRAWRVGSACASGATRDPRSGIAARLIAGPGQEIHEIEFEVPKILSTSEEIAGCLAQVRQIALRPVKNNHQ
jgi:hypothetical protein